MSYRHSDDEVGGSLVEFAYARYEKRGDVGYQCLYNEDDGNDGELSQLLGRQLGCELGEN